MKLIKISKMFPNYAWLVPKKNLASNLKKSLMKSITKLIWILLSGVNEQILGTVIIKKLLLYLRLFLMDHLVKTTLMRYFVGKFFRWEIFKFIWIKNLVRYWASLKDILCRRVSVGLICWKIQKKLGKSQKVH